MNKATVVIGIIIGVLGWGTIGYCAFSIQQSYVGVHWSNMALACNQTDVAQHSWSLPYPWIMMYSGFPAGLGTILAVMGYFDVSLLDFKIASNSDNQMVKKNE